MSAWVTLSFQTLAKLIAEAGIAGDRYQQGAGKYLQIEEIWDSIRVSHVFGEESSSFLIERSLMRPRNLLKLLNYARAFAVNFGKEKIDIDNFFKGLKAYSQDLLIEVNRELSDVFPEAANLLYYFIDSEVKMNVQELEKSSLRLELMQKMSMLSENFCYTTVCWGYL